MRFNFVLQMGFLSTGNEFDNRSNLTNVNITILGKRNEPLLSIHPLCSVLIFHTSLDEKMLAHGHNLTFLPTGSFSIHEKTHTGTVVYEHSRLNYFPFPFLTLCLVSGSRVTDESLNMCQLEVKGVKDEVVTGSNAASHIVANTVILVMQL